jgi:hypothetical protein
MTQAQNPNAVASARQQLVEVAGWPGYWATKQGGETTSEVSKVWDGGSLDPETMAGPADTGNITVTRPYRPAVHGPIRKAWAAQVGRLRTTVSMWDTDPDLGPVGTPSVYANALLVRCTPPGHDASSSDPGTVELEFAVGKEA